MLFPLYLVSVFKLIFELQSGNKDNGTSISEIDYLCFAYGSRDMTFLMGYLSETNIIKAKELIITSFHPFCEHL
jgi:hypothetical protein